MFCFLVVHYVKNLLRVIFLQNISFYLYVVKFILKSKWLEFCFSKVAHRLRLKQEKTRQSRTWLIKLFSSCSKITFSCNFSTQENAFSCSAALVTLILALMSVILLDSPCRQQKYLFHQRLRLCLQANLVHVLNQFSHIFL